MLDLQDAETATIETFDVDESVLDPAGLQSLQQMEGRGAISVDRMFALFVDNGERILPVLREALEARDAARLQLEAHSLKGSAGYLGARRLAALCQEVEALGKANTLGDVADPLKDIESAFEEAHQALRQILPDAEGATRSVTADAPSEWDLDELESSARQQLPAVLEFLTAQKDRWSRLCATMDITDTEEFGEDIRQVGVTYNCPPLQRWGETLAACSRNFDIEGVQTIIGQFDDVIVRVQNWTESDTTT